MEAMEDYLSPSKKFWQAVRHPRRDKQCSTNSVYRAGGKMLTSTVDVVEWWKEYFEDLLNPTVKSSAEEAETGVEVDSSITQAKVTEVLTKCPGSG